MISTRARWSNACAAAAVPASIALVVVLCMAAGISHAQHQEFTGGPLPKDAAPFVGLAQSPEANLFSGSAATSIPIAVPPGRKSQTPRLALSYSSSGGPSAYGYGWDLPVGHIQRSTDHGVLTCGTLTHREDFVLVLPAQTVEFTRDAAGKGIARIEEHFVRIQHIAAGNYWEVWDKSGIRYRFGESVHARTGTDVTTLYHAQSCQSADSYTPIGTFSWGLTSIEDPNGNRLQVEYAPSINLQYGIAYPERILYGGHSSGLDHLFEVDLTWAAARPTGDEVVTGLGGFAARLTRILAEIVVRYPVGGSVVRRYALDYELDVGAARLGRQAFLSAVTLYDGSGNALARYDGLPASSTFLYQEPRPNDLGFGLAQHAPKPSPPPGLSFGYGRQSDNSNGESTRDILDMNGDSLPDWVVTPSQSACAGDPFWYVYLGSPAGFATTPVIWDTPACLIRDGRSSGDPKNTYSDKDTLDLSGDSIPDFIDTTTWTSGSPFWRVHVGVVTSSGGYFAAAPLLWYAPVKELRHTVAGEISGFGYSSEPGSVDLRDLIDLNGDGLVDLVRSDTGGFGVWNVWLNTGSGFDTVGRDFPVSLGGSLRWTRKKDEIFGIRDMNGDGLPDQVFSGSGDVPWPGFWYVTLNSGSGLNVVEQWDVPAIPNLRHLRRLSDNHNNVTRDIFDINGDGLPDIVDREGWSAGSPYWRVVLNRGDGFSETVLSWASPSAVIRQGGDGYTYSDTFDIDGDGLADYVDFSALASAVTVSRNATGAWCASASGTTCATSAGSTGVAANPEGARPDLLLQLENGVGGRTTIDYRPSSQWDNSGGDSVPDLPFCLWTVTRIERDDGMCDDGGTACTTSGAHSIVRNLSYQYGRFDPGARVFRGFQIVTSRDADGASPPVQGRTTYFHQSAALAGKMSDVWVYDAAAGGQFLAPLTRTVSTWECANPTTGAVITCPAQPAGNVWVRLKRTEDYAYTDFLLFTYQRATTETHAWHQCGGKFYGNVAHSSSGDPSGGVRSHTHTEYACLTTSSAYIVDRPTHVWTNATGDAVTLAEKWFFYDQQGLGGLQKGDLTKRETWLDRWTDSATSCSASSKQCVANRMEYDTYGNLTGVYDALNRLAQTQYDAATQIYPFVITTPAPLLHRAATQYDPACGVLLWQSIPYTGMAIPAQRTQWQYDSFCRLFAAALPDEDPVVSPHQVVIYTLGGPQQPSRIFAWTREPTGTLGFSYTHTWTDALGRMVQEHRSSVVDGTAGFTAASTLEFDPRGNPTKQYAPFVLSQSPSSYTTPPAGTGFTTKAHDALNRTTRVTNPDGTYREVDHRTAWQTTSLDECYNSPTCAGGKTMELRDALGRVTEQRWYEENTFKTRSVSTYDEVGRLLSTEQGATETSLNPNTRTTIVYDTLGRKVEMMDPDSGLWRYGYDAVGNLRYQDDPKSGQHVQHCYDTLSRLTLTCPLTSDYTGVLIPCTSAPCSSDEVRATYDKATVPNGLGRLTDVVDASGETHFEQYDLRGRLLQVTKEIDALGDGQNLSSATTSYSYDAADHLIELTYPDGEAVEYQYDGAGQVVRVRSATHQMDYLAGATYDVFGRSRTLTRGNGTTDTRAYGGPASNYRLNLLATNAGGALRLSYGYVAYSPTGLVQQITDNGPKGPGNVMDNSASLTYDGLGRLSQATGPQLGTLAYQYDYLGNLTAKEGMTLAYASAKPHTLQKINGSATGISHDPNGNRLGKPGHSYQYDGQDRLRDCNGGQIRYRYDYTGRRVAKIVNGSPVTVYYSELAESAGGWMTKYYFAGNALLATRRGQASGFAAAERDGVRLASVSLLHPALVLRVGHDARLGLLLTSGAVFATLLLLPSRRKRNVGIALRHGHVIGVAIAFGVTTLPWPVLVRRAEGCGPPPSSVFHYHVDHVGSTQLITDASGAVVEYVRYRPYGDVRGRYNASGSIITPSELHRYEFTGYESEFSSGLQYAGARFYDPALAQFLTHDPARQFASPYAYGTWSPLNGTDSNGAFWAALIPIIKFIVVSAVVSAAVNAAIAAAQGASLNQIGQAAMRGSITGAVGAGLGVVAAGANIGLATLANTMPAGVGMPEALNALGEVAKRAAFSTTLANAAGRTAEAAGASSGWVMGASFAGGYAGSFIYDQAILDVAGDLARIESKGLFQQVSNTPTHNDITMAAAQDAGFTPANAQAIVTGNLDQDKGLTNVLMNHTHFNATAQSATKAATEYYKNLAPGNPWTNFLKAWGAVTHYIQDQYALGHIFPGTGNLHGPWAAPFRFIIHQTVGGEVNFFSIVGNARIPSSYGATRGILGRAYDAVGNGPTAI